MADILIKGMKMPENCSMCPFNKYSTWCKVTMSEIDRDYEHKERLSDCPLIPLPEKHGRLGDLDALYELVKQRSRSWTGSWCDAECLITGNDIKKAPTVIPASE